jgi:two-component system, LuxR family, sensor kinase FixL
MKKGMLDGFALPHGGPRFPTLVSFDAAEVERIAASDHDAVSASVGCFDIGREGIILQANPAGARLLGFEHDELIGRHFCSFVADKDQAGFASMMEQVFVGGKAQACSDLTLVDQVGEAPREVYCMASADTLRSICYFALVDNAERKQMGSKPPQNEAAFRGIFETMRDLYYRADPDGHVEMVSPSCLSLTGYTSEEVMGRQVSEFYADPGQRVKFLAALQQKGHVDDFELRLRHKDGSIRDVSASCCLIHDQANRLLGVEGILRDITERKQAEQEVRRSRIRLVEAQRIAGLGDWELDLTTNELRWSDEIYRIFEIDPRQFGASYEDFLAVVHPDDREWVDGAYTESVKSRLPYDIVHRLLFAGGRVKYVHGRCETVYDEAGRPLRSHGTVQDISERKRMEMDIQEYQSRQDELLHEHIAVQTAAAIAHDLNQPLLAISAYCEAVLKMLENGSPDQQKLTDAIGASARQAMRAGNAIRDMLAFLSKREVWVEPFDLGLEIHFALESLKREQVKAVRATVEQPDDMPLVLANRLQVQKVLGNLIQNAVDAMCKAGVHHPHLNIDVGMAQDEGMIEVTIADNGPGIRGEDAVAIFEPFYSTKPYGLGMGLTVSRAMIEAQGGRLWADSLPRGGAVFHFTLQVVR